MNKPKGFKKYFKLNSLRRIIILGVTAAAAVLAIVLGSVLYTTDSKNVRKSSEYSANAEYNIKVSKFSSNNDSLTEIANQVYDRIDPLGLKGTKISTYTEAGNDFIKVIYPNVNSDAELKSIEKLITHKPKITITNISGQPIFNQTGTGPSAAVNGGTVWDYKNWSSNLVNQSTVPLSTNGASVVNNNGSMRVKINLNDANAWMMTSLYLSGALSGQQTTTVPKVVLWSDIDEWIDDLKNTQTPQQGVSLWDNAGNDPYKALYVGNDPSTGILRDNASFLNGNALNHRLAEFELSATGSNATIANYQYLVLKDGFELSQINEIVRKINFSTAKFELTTVSDKILAPSQGSTAFRNFVIFAIVAFSLIAVALMVNYGLLGALATISLALFTFITLTLFTVMRGEYSPESIAALIVGFGLSLDAIISMFEKLRTEIHLGQNFIKASKTTVKKSLWTIIDSNVVTLIIATVLFYFGTKSIIGFSISMVFGIMATLVVTNLFVGLTTALLLRSGYFDKKASWVGVNAKFDAKLQFSVNKIDFVKQSRWSFFIGLALVFAGIVIAVVLGSIHGGNNLFNHSGLNMKMINDCLIAIGISFAVIIAYVMVRFRWTYVVTLLYSLIQEIWLVITIYIAARINVSPTFIAALLGIIIFSLNDKVVVFDRLKEKIKAKYNLTDYNQIKEAANEAIRTLFRRNVIVTMLMLASTIVLIGLNNIILWQASLVLLVGLMINFASSNFIVPAVWTKMEIIRQKGIAWRTKKNFWDTKSVEEQVIVGINDYRQ